MRKSRFGVITVVVLLLIALYFVIVKTKSTLSKKETEFAVKDTSAIVKVFLANKVGDQVTLEKNSQGEWKINGKYKARNDMVNTLLATIRDIQILAPLSKSAHNNIVKLMAASSTKVEIYVKSYRIRLFKNKIRWFPYVKLEKVYYIGVPTQDKLGTYMLIEGAKTPCITYIPGFNGFLSTRYTAHANEWRDRTIFRYLVGEIKSIKIEPQDEKESFEIINAGRRKFQLKSISGNQIINYTDTTKMLDYLTNFYKVGFEFFTDGMNKKEIDSIIKTKPYYKISVTDINGKVNEVRTYRRIAPIGYLDMWGNPQEYDVDKLYALINKGDDFVVIQYYSFDKIFRKLTYFKANDDAGNRAKN
ncbi:MAG: hypothetical protein PHD97_06260 [Bacteroidales bacterium]|nr:hypothetical protein [Bacteroidales bacterium]